MSPLNGGPAFPWREEDGAGGYDQHVGMSLRDWFAGQALFGIMANYTTAKFGATDLDIARGAYDYADAMLVARGKMEGDK